MQRPFIILLLLCLVGCGPGTKKTVLRLAVTTSTYDSGLIETLTEDFEKRHEVRIDVISAGTGKALALGRGGDVELVLVHSRQDEDKFMAAGHGRRREEVMFNHFCLLGPESDPAKVRGLAPQQALQKIAVGEFPFVSRGDNSGTHRREQSLWKSAGGRKDWKRFTQTGLGQGRTLIVANERKSYVLSDSGTYNAYRDKIKLVPLIVSDEQLKNIYGVMVVNKKNNTNMQKQLAGQFVDFLISQRGQTLIKEFRKNDEQLFFPLRISAQEDSAK